MGSSAGEDPVPSIVRSDMRTRAAFMSWAGATAKLAQPHRPGRDAWPRRLLHPRLRPQHRRRDHGRNKFGPIGDHGGTTSGRGGGARSRRSTPPVFVLTHHLRPSFTLDDTTFHFIDASPTEAFARAGGRWTAGTCAWAGSATVRVPRRRSRRRHAHVAMAPVDLGAANACGTGRDLLDRFPWKVPSPSSGSSTTSSGGVEHRLVSPWTRRRTTAR